MALYKRRPRNVIHHSEPIKLKNTSVAFGHRWWQEGVRPFHGHGRGLLRQGCVRAFSPRW